MRTKQSSLLDELRSELPRPRAFWERTLPEDLQSEIEQLKAQFLAGDLSCSKRGFSNALSNVLKRRGFPIGRSGIERWLAQK
jgi:hypothetical protein